MKVNPDLLPCSGVEFFKLNHVETIRPDNRMVFLDGKVSNLMLVGTESKSC